jgi:hypothetical protein
MYFVLGVYGRYTLHDPTPKGSPGPPRASLTPPSGSWARSRQSIPLVGSSDDICNVSCARNVIWATHFNTFLAWVETRGHRASYEMYERP